MVWLLSYPLRILAKHSCTKESQRVFSFENTKNSDISFLISFTKALTGRGHIPDSLVQAWVKSSNIWRLLKYPCTLLCPWKQVLEKLLISGTHWKGVFGYTFQIQRINECGFTHTQANTHTHMRTPLRTPLFI